MCVFCNLRIVLVHLDLCSRMYVLYSLQIAIEPDVDVEVIIATPDSK
jgi:hypothetical protein